MGSRRDWARANSTHNRQSIVAMEPPAPAPAPGAPAVVIFECGQRKGQFYLRPDAHISVRRARRCFLWQHMTVPLLFDSIHCGRTGVPSRLRRPAMDSRLLIRPDWADCARKGMRFSSPMVEISGGLGRRVLVMRDCKDSKAPSVGLAGLGPMVSFKDVVVKSKEIGCLGDSHRRAWGSGTGRIRQLSEPREL